MKKTKKFSLLLCTFVLCVMLAIPENTIFKKVGSILPETEIPFEY